MKREKKQKGITLIALVITIVVLLILAGVTIATLTGDNGILTRASEASERTKQANEEELRKLTALEATMNTEETAHTDNSTGEEKTVTIPAGFAVSQIEGEDTIEEGLVIIDKNGNEFVWIEVPKTEEVYKNTGIKLDINDITDEQCNIIYNDLANYANEYRQEGWEDIFYSKEQHGFADVEEYNSQKNKMLRSIYLNEGFWIGRYEAGTENNYRCYGEDFDIEHPITETPVVKANVYPYTYITCKQAQTLAKQFSTDTETGSLMYGIQWDLVCKFLEVKGGLTRTEIKGGDEIGSTNWGNYNNSSIVLLQGKYNTIPYNTESLWLNIISGNKNGAMLLTTGASEDTRKLNIYDLAGNEREWTLEYSGDERDPIVCRGGYYNYDGVNHPASDRSHYSFDTNSNSVGFRISLY